MNYSDVHPLCFFFIYRSLSIVKSIHSSAFEHGTFWETTSPKSLVGLLHYNYGKIIFLDKYMQINSHLLVSGRNACSIDGENVFRPPSEPNT